MNPNRIPLPPFDGLRQIHPAQGGFNDLINSHCRHAKTSRRLAIDFKLYIRHAKDNIRIHRRRIDLRDLPQALGHRLSERTNVRGRFQRRTAPS